MGGAWRTISVALRADTAGYLGPLATASAATRKLGSEVDATTKRASSGWSALSKAVKVGAAGLVLAVGAFIGASINAAAKFEEQMSGIGAVSGATAAEMDLLREKAIQLGADTAFSASEAASAMEELVKAGVPVAGVLNGAADATVALAAAGGIDLPEAAAISANAMNQFGLAASELPHIADLIAGAANASSIDVSDFGMSMSQAGAVANLVGLSFDDTALAITAMGNAGIKSSDAGTSLKTFLTNLVPSTEKAKGMMSDLGIVTEETGNRFFDSSGELKSLSDISGVLGEALKGMTKEQKLATLQTLFGSDAIRAAAVITEQGVKGFEDLNDVLQKSDAAEIGRKRMDNLKGSLEQLKGSVETAMIMVGSKFLPALRDAADGATDFVNALTSGDLSGTFLNQIADVARNLAPAWRNVVDIGGDLVDILGEVGSIVGPLAGDMAKLAAAAAIVGLNTLAAGLEALTGFLAENEGLVKALTVALVALGAAKGFTLLATTASLAVAPLLAMRTAMQGIAATQGVSTSLASFGVLKASLPNLTLAAQGVSGMTRNLLAVPDASSRMASGFSQGAASFKQGARGMASSLARPQVAIALLAVAFVDMFSEVQAASNKAKKTIDDLKPEGFDEANLGSMRAYSDALVMATADAKVAEEANDNFFGALRGVAELAMPGVASGANDANVAYQQLAGTTQEVAGATNALNATLVEIGRLTGLSGEQVQAWLDKLKLDPMSGAQWEIAGKIDDAANAARNGTPATDSLGTSLATMADNTSSATEKLDAFKSAMDSVLGIPLDLADSQREWQQSIRDTGQSLMDLAATDPAAFAAGGAEAFDILTESGIKTDAAFSGLIKKGYDVAKSLRAAGDSAGATAQLNETRDQVIKLGEAFGIPTTEIEKYLLTIGLTPEQIETFVALNGADTAQDKLDSLTQQQRVAEVIAKAITDNADADLTTTTGRRRIADIVADAITGQAEFGLAGVTDKKRVADILAVALAGGADFDLNTVAGRNRAARIVAQAVNVVGVNIQLDDAAKTRTAHINLVIGAIQKSTGLSTGQIFGNRWGGITEYASGGVNNITTAGIYRGDLIRFAEPETIKEAYIPFRGDPARSMSTLMETASWFGATVVPKNMMAKMATGGIISTSSVPRNVLVPAGGSGRGGVTVVVNAPITITGNGDETVRRIARTEVLPTIKMLPGQVVRALRTYSDGVEQ